MSQVIRDEIMVFIHISVNIIIRSSISVLGISTNIINMIIFSEFGLKDSMSIGVFALSVTDFLTSSQVLASCMCYAAHLLYPDSSVDIWSLGYFVFGWVINATYSISCWITALISVERLLCVVSPFRVKQVFTRFRCTIAIFIIYIVYIVLCVPNYVFHVMKWVYITPAALQENATILIDRVFTVTFNQETARFEFIFDITLGMGIIFLTVAIVLICAVWMGYSLEVSSRVRQSIPGLNSGDEAKSLYSAAPSSALSTRERKLVKVVLYLGIVLTLCRIPNLIAGIVYHTIPGMNTGQQENLATTLWAITSAIGSLGCSANFFVYLILNTKYRHRFHQMFGRNLSNLPSKSSMVTEIVDQEDEHEKKTIMNKKETN